MLIDPLGLVLTSDHVVAGANRIVVTLTDSRKFPGKTVGNNAQIDLALVRVKEEEFPVLLLGRSTGLRLGQGVVVVGGGVRKDREVTLGTENAIGSFVAYWEFMLVRVVHTDALIRRGYSGDPLVNMRGEMVGVVSYPRPTAPGFAGLGIPIEAASSLRWGSLSAGQVSRRGRIQRLTPGGPATCVKASCRKTSSRM